MSCRGRNSVAACDECPESGLHAQQLKTVVKGRKGPAYAIRNTSRLGENAGFECSNSSERGPETGTGCYQTGDCGDESEPTGGSLIPSLRRCIRNLLQCVVLLFCSIICCRVMWRSYHLHSTLSRGEDIHLVSIIAIWQRPLNGLPLQHYRTRMSDRFGPNSRGHLCLHSTCQVCHGHTFKLLLE